MNKVTANVKKSRVPQIYVNKVDKQSSQKVRTRKEFIIVRHDPRFNAINLGSSLCKPERERTHRRATADESSQSHWLQGYLTLSCFRDHRRVRGRRGRWRGVHLQRFWGARPKRKQENHLSKVGEHFLRILNFCEWNKMPPCPRYEQFYLKHW